MTNIYQAYSTFFGHDDELTHIFSPYAICPLGAHVDHQHGMVAGFAIDKGIDFLFSPTETGKVEVASLSFSGLMTFNVTLPMYEKQQNWGDYLRGAVWALQRSHTLRRGVRGIISGSIPSGGVASSAALTCAFIMALDHVNNLQLNREQIIQAASMAERFYIGLNNGVLDQTCVMLSEPHQLLYIDAHSQEHHLLPFGGLDSHQPLPFRAAVFYSGVTDVLTNTDYNLRVQECRTAAWMLQAYAGLPLKKLEETTLHDITNDQFVRYESMMPKRFARRAHHYFYENSRVQLGRRAWLKGDIATFGQLMFDSCESSISNYECGAEELIDLYRILRQTDGVLGARFSGPGFLGSCVALVDPGKEEQIAATVGEAYAQQHPQYKDAYKAFFCHSHSKAAIVVER